MTEEIRHVEPLHEYIPRRYGEMLAAVYLSCAVAILDVSLVLGWTRGPLSVLVLVNVGLVLIVVLLLVISPSWSEMRRYRVTSAWVMLPVQRRTLPEQLALSDILGVALYPAASPLSNHPSLVELAISANNGTVRVIVRTKSFGLGNLRDLVSRLPDDKLDPEFARKWKQTLAF